MEDLRSIIEHLHRYSETDDGSTGKLTLTSLRDQALLLVGWIGAIRRSELVALATADIKFIGDEGVNVASARVAEGTVAETRRRFFERRLTGCVERKLDGEQEAKLIQLACSEAPEGRSQ